MNKIIIFGGTGFIGLALAKYLKSKHLEPIIIGRNRPKQMNFTYIHWDAQNLGDWTQVLEDANAVVNLCGRSVDCIKTPANCDLILRSRVESTKLIGEALKATENPPQVWVQMSTAHIYGDPPTLTCTESSSFGYGLAPFVGQKWEEALEKLLLPNMREVRLRTSFVIGNTGGAFPKLKLISKLGLGGKIGNGTQGLSWIHITDMCDIIYQSIINVNYSGPIICSSPNPLSQKEFMHTLRKAMKIPFGLPAAEWMVEFGAKYLFKTDPDLLLYGRYVKSERLPYLGFEFKFGKLEGALQELMD